MQDEKVPKMAELGALHASRLPDMLKENGVGRSDMAEIAVAAGVSVSTLFPSAFISVFNKYGVERALEWANISLGDLVRNTNVRLQELEADERVRLGPLVVEESGNE